MATNVALVCISLVGVIYGEPQWQSDQRTHQITQLPSGDLDRVCRMTDRDSLRKYLTPLLVVRPVGSAALKNVGLFIARTLRQAGFDVEIQKFNDRTPLGEKTFRNIIGTFEEKRPRRLTLACHYDSKYSKTNDFIGATDSAAPCAMLLDIAVTLGPHLYRRRNSDIALQLLFLDGEEAFRTWSATDSLYGARYMAEQMSKKWYPSDQWYLSNDLERMDVFVLLDLLGAKNPTILNHDYGATPIFSDIAKTERDLKSKLDGCLHWNVPNIFTDSKAHWPVEDDHQPFYKKGVPIVHLITTPFPSVWHTVYDNGDVLDYPTMENTLSVLRVWVSKYLNITFSNTSTIANPTSG